jgi:Rrf2 family protein
MIRLSTKGRYGTRLMLNLAHNYNNGNDAIILKNVSDAEEISIRYLEQIIIPLKINKLVKSIRGAGGGYILARHPSQIKLSDILNSLEGTMSLVECVEDDGYCDRTDVCVTHEIWKKASSMLQDYFESLTLQDLADHENKKKKSKKK